MVVFEAVEVVVEAVEVLEAVEVEVEALEVIEALFAITLLSLQY